jgi:hypothetical protein
VAPLVWRRPPPATNERRRRRRHLTAGVQPKPPARARPIYHAPQTLCFQLADDDAVSVAGNKSKLRASESGLPTICRRPGRFSHSLNGGRPTVALGALQWRRATNRAQASRPFRRGRSSSAASDAAGGCSLAVSGGGGRAQIAELASRCGNWRERVIALPGGGGGFRFVVNVFAPSIPIMIHEAAVGGVLLACATLSGGAHWTKALRFDGAPRSSEMLVATSGNEPARPPHTGVRAHTRPTSTTNSAAPDGETTSAAAAAAAPSDVADSSPCPHDSAAGRSVAARTNSPPPPPDFSLLLLACRRLPPPPL